MNSSSNTRMVYVVNSALLILFLLLVIKITNHLYFFYGIDHLFHEIHFRYYSLAFAVITAIIISLIVIFGRQRIQRTIFSEEKKTHWIIGMALIVMNTFLLNVIPLWTNKKLISAINRPELEEHFTIIDLAEIELIRDQWTILSQVLFLTIVFLVFIRKAEKLKA